MTLAQKLLLFRTNEGMLRQLGRALTQTEVIQELQEMGYTISQPYLSLLENGHRTHLTDATKKAFAALYRMNPRVFNSEKEDGSLKDALLSDLSQRTEKDPIWQAINALLLSK